MIKIMSINLKLGNSSSFSQPPLLFNHISVRFNSSFFHFHPVFCFFVLYNIFINNIIGKSIVSFDGTRGKKVSQINNKKRPKSLFVVMVS